MKEHEAVTRLVLPRRSLSVVRVDGRTFRTYTRGLDRPFDATFAADMDAVAVSLCEMISGVVLAYVQSDEISVVFHDLARENTLPWLGGVVSKIVSLTAAQATATMAVRRPPSNLGKVALFDSRVFTVPDDHQLAAYLVGRQRDAERNALSMAAQAHFSQKSLQGRSTNDMLTMLDEVGIAFDDYPEGFRRGRVVHRRDVTKRVQWTRTHTKGVTTTVVTRSPWTVEPAPGFTTNEDGWLRHEVLSTFNQDRRPLMAQPTLEESYQSGLNAGWDAANYADANGGSPIPTDGAIPGWIALANTDRDALVARWRDGVQEGQERFGQGMFADGTPVSPEGEV